jgi:hypothetical protein
LAKWKESDFIAGYVRPNLAAPQFLARIIPILNSILEGARAGGKPLIIIMQPGVPPDAAVQMAEIANLFIARGVPIYYSFSGAAAAISAVVNWKERRKR